MKTFSQLIKECQKTVKELMPWDLEKQLESDTPPLIIDVREPQEYNAMHIENSTLVPRGILETACEYGFEETIPSLVEAREKPIVLVCRSGNRSLFAAQTMQIMGYQQVYSLMTGLRGWNDYELALIDSENKTVDIDDADIFFESRVSDDQLPPK